MSLEQLKQDPQFAQLTDKQKVFVEQYIALNRDFVKAARMAYECKDDRSARAVANQMLRKPAIADLLDKYYGPEPISIDEFAAWVLRSAKTTKSSKDRKELMVLYARLQGWGNRNGDPSIPATTGVRELLAEFGTH